MLPRVKRVRGSAEWSLVLPAVIASMAGSFIIVSRPRDKYVNFAMPLSR